MHELAQNNVCVVCKKLIDKNIFSASFVAYRLIEQIIILINK